MIFITYTQNELKENPSLINFLFETICDNLNYLFGKEMKSEENKKEWMSYNIEKNNDYWLCTIAFDNNDPCGFIIYEINLMTKSLTINEIEIKKLYRHNPVLIKGLFKEVLFKNNFDVIKGYINKENYESQKNFLKYANIVNETKTGFIIEINSKKIKDRFNHIQK